MLGLGAPSLDLGVTHMHTAMIMRGLFLVARVDCDLTLDRTYARHTEAHYACTTVCMRA